jgi:serine/threonine protein kinase
VSPDVERTDALFPPPKSDEFDFQLANPLPAPEFHYLRLIANTHAAADAEATSTSDFLALLDNDAPRPHTLPGTIHYFPDNESQKAPEPSDHPLPATFGRFRISRRLGRGATGLVFLAFDPMHGREIALKVARPEMVADLQRRERFLTEAQAAANLDHPNLVPVYGIGEHGGLWFIEEAYCPGPTLAKWLADRKEPIPPKRAAWLVADLAQGLSYIHARGIIHRDLKPSNVILEPRSRTAVQPQSTPQSAAACVAPSPNGDDFPFVPRLTDFGLAKLLDVDGESTASGAIMGTPHYMSPEQAEGRHGEIGPHTDVWALGAMFYELLTRQPPFRAKTPMATLRRVLFDDPVPPRRLAPHVPRPLQAICLRCLEKDIDLRYRCAADLVADLERWKTGQRLRAQPLTGLKRTWRRYRRDRFLIGLLVVMAALALGSIACLATGVGMMAASQSREAPIR